MQQDNKHWDEYQLILVLHRQGTLRSAADVLSVNHSTVSRRLAYLNKRYVHPIFEQTPSGYKITEHGLPLLQAAENIEEIIFRSNRQFNALDIEMAGDIHLSIPEAIGQYLLIDALSEFQSRYPHINLYVNSSYQFVDLDRLEADVVIRGTEHPPEHLVGHRTYPYHLHYYCHKDYIANTAKNDMRWIVAPSNSHRPSWLDDTPYPDVEVGLTVSDITLRHRMILAGKGLARGACFMADPEPNLVRLGQSKPQPAYPIWVLTHPDLRNTPRIKVLMEFLLRVLNEKRALIEGRELNA